MRSWTDKHRNWVMQLKFEQRALEETLTDYAAEADHQRERVARMARHAESGFVRWLEIVRLVAAHARSTPAVSRRVRGRNRLVTTRAGAHEGGRIRRMRVVAGDARFLAAVIDLDVRVTPAARLRRQLWRVGRVASEARLVRISARRQERLLGFVAAETRARAPCQELVRLVAADAIAVGGGLRGLLLGMATRTRGRAAAAGACPLWQSRQPRDPPCSACMGALSAWQGVQLFGTIAGSPWSLWHSAHSVVACMVTAARGPRGLAWHEIHFGAV
jgi:hypothetical protein